MQVRRSPIARWSRTAATDESTPPESPRTTPSVPVLSRILATLLSTKECIVQVGERSQTRNRKLARISFPRGVWTTSGWNCTPKIVPSWLDIAATGVLPDRAMEENPFGSSSIRSPWLIQTGISMSWRNSSIPRKRGLPHCPRMFAIPYSRSSERPTFPPRRSATSCIP